MSKILSVRLMKSDMARVRAVIINCIDFSPYHAVCSNVSWPSVELLNWPVSVNTTLVLQPASKLI